MQKRETDPDDAEANNMMAQLLFEQQRLTNQGNFRTVVKIKPDWGKYAWNDSQPSGKAGGDSCLYTGDSP
jgi:hypothetical protein